MKRKCLISLLMYNIFIFHISNFLKEFTEALFVLLKVYRIFCYAKITLDQIPLINPYVWPTSVIRLTTSPYFNYWSLRLPNIKLGLMSYQASNLIALEILNILIRMTYFMYKFAVRELLKNDPQYALLF